MVEFIKYQGEVIGNAELKARITALEYHAYARFGMWATTVRLHARFAWHEFPGKDHSRHTLIAKEK